jgi:hypothetical protein
MNARNLIGAIGLAAVVASTAAVTSAQVVTPPKSTQVRSNLNLERIADRIKWQIAFLNHDQRDFGGHRVAAIQDLQNAFTELRAAEAFAGTQGHGTVGTNPGPNPKVNKSVPRRSEQLSATNITNVRAKIQLLIFRLQQDSHDYGGHRIAAINDLQGAVNELTAALQYAQTHPGT